MKDCEHRLRRKRSLWLAITTSLLSKGGNAVLQLLAMPLAYAVLGKERFGLFGTLQAVMWFIYLCDFGVSGGLSRRLTAAVASGDKKEQGEIMSSGFFVTVFFACVMAVLGAALLIFVPVTTLFGEKFAPYADELDHTLWLALGVFLAMVVGVMLLKAREAYQELHIFNIFGAVGNVVSAVVLYVGIRYIPEVWYLLLALYGVQLLSYWLNGVSGLAKRPWLVPRISNMRRPLVKVMLSEGLAFFVALSLTPILAREGIRWLLGQEYGPETVGLYSILIQLGFFMLGFVVMFTAPLMPAVADATARHDFAWIRSLHRRTLRLFVPAAAGIALFLIVLGPWFVHFWMRDKDIPLGRQELALFGVYFLFMVWSHIHATLLTSCGLARPAAAVLAVECVAVLGCAWAGIHKAGLLGALLAGAVGMAAVSSWALPMLLRRYLQAQGKPAEVRPEQTSALPQNPSTDPMS